MPETAALQHRLAPPRPARSVRSRCCADRSARHQARSSRCSPSLHSEQSDRRAYRDFHRRIAAHIDPSIAGKIVELDSGIGNIRDVIPACLRTDLFANPWIDQVENAYQLTFRDGEVSHLILFDVFHHLQYPRTALRECRRVLGQGGRVIIFGPYVSLTGRLVYGPLHHEPIGNDRPIAADVPAAFDPHRHDYYADQGNATRVFWNGHAPEILDGWEVIARERLGAWAYALTGGYSKPQLYPAALYPLMSGIDTVAEMLPQLFALRALIVYARTLSIRCHRPCQPRRTILRRRATRARSTDCSTLRSPGRSCRERRARCKSRSPPRNTGTSQAANHPSSLDKLNWNLISEGAGCTRI